MKEYFLRYNYPASNFQEALPIGNGKLGAMVYGTYPVEKLTLNHDTLWSGKPRSYTKKGAYDAYCRAMDAIDEYDFVRTESILESGFASPYTQAYLSLGTLAFDFAIDEVKDYHRELDMEQGIVKVSCSAYSIEHLASYDHHCIVSHLVFHEKESVKIKLDSLLKHEVAVCNGTLILRGECPSHRVGPIYEYDGEGIHFAAIVKIQTDGVYVEKDDQICVHEARYVDVFFTTETSFINYKDISKTDYEQAAILQAEACVKTGYDVIKKAQLRYYGQHLETIQLNLSGQPISENTDLRLKKENQDIGLLELIFNYGRYLTVASSAKGSEATNLQGIWNESLTPPWFSNYTVNINTEMNYWHALSCGLTDFYWPLIELVKKIADTGRLTAQEYYHADGFVCHHNVDLWGHTTAVGENRPGCTVFAYWCGGSGWLCRALFEYYEYTLDKEFLKQIAYPILKDAATFYQCVLRPADGRLAVSPSTSPENRYILNGEKHSISRWTTMSQSIVADLFKNCVTCCEILDVDHDWKQELEEIIPQLKPFVIMKDGRLAEWGEEHEEADVHHRHVSHLYGLYPGELITNESTPELAEACRKSLEVRGDDGTGWSIIWKASLWAKLKDGDRALKLIRLILNPLESTFTQCGNTGGGIYPNLFFACPPFQIDANFGIEAAVLLLLLQHEDGMIKLLPALPKELATGSVKGLMTKGNIKVDMSWQDGKVTELSLVSKYSQTAKLQINGKICEIELKENEIKQFIL